MESIKFVAYYRVSTVRQGMSGLGLEAQREQVTRFLNGHTLEAEFTEVETGTGADALAKRPQLRAAIALAKRSKASILIAKLDRLARNVHFISGLQEAGVAFVAADMPEANELTINLMAAMAQHEARMISARTKAALAAKKGRGEPLGNAHLLARGNATKARNAQAFAGTLRTTLEAFRAQGMTQRGIVAELNKLGVSTPTGAGMWHQRQLQRVLARL